MDEYRNFVPFLLWYHQIGLVPHRKKNDFEVMERDIKRKLKGIKSVLPTIVDYFEDFDRKPVDSFKIRYGPVTPKFLHDSGSKRLHFGQDAINVYSFHF